MARKLKSSSSSASLKSTKEKGEAKMSNKSTCTAKEQQCSEPVTPCFMRAGFVECTLSEPHSPQEHGPELQDGSGVQKRPDGSLSGWGLLLWRIGSQYIWKRLRRSKVAHSPFGDAGF